MPEITRLQATATADFSQFTREVQAANKQFMDFASGLQRQASSLGSVLSGGFLTGIGIGAGVAAFRGITSAVQESGAELINFSSTLQRAGYAFTAFAGGGEKGTITAQNFLAQLKEMAATTPFTFEQITAGAQRFVGMGVQMDRVIPIMKDISVVAQAMGASSAQIDRINLAVSQVVARGKLQMQEVNQLANEGVQAIKILADAEGKTPAAIIAAMEKGQISANEFLNALDKYAHDPRLLAMADAVNHSFDTAQSNVHDRLQQLGSEAIAPFFSGLTDIMNGLSEALNTDAVKQFAADVATTFSDIGSRLAPLKDGFAAAFADLSNGHIGAAVTDALQAIGNQIAAFGQALFGGGYAMMASLANGIMSGAGDLIAQAANYVASIIASFLVGQSPPPEGPLSKIDEAGRTLINTYVGGMAGGVAGMAAVADQLAGQFDTVNSSLRLSDGQAGIAAATSNLRDLKTASEDVTSSINQINGALHDIDSASRDLRFALDDINDSYKTQSDAIQEQIDGLNQVVDLQQQQADIADKIAGLELDKKINADKGSPIERAKIQSKLDANRLDQEDIQNQIRALELNNTKGRNDKEIAALKARGVELDRQELGYKRELAGLVDKEALARDTQAKSELDATGKQRDIDKQILDLQTKQKQLPLIDQAKRLEDEHKKLVKPLEDQLRIYDRQRAVLQAQKQDWDELKAKIGEATSKLNDAKAGAKGGAVKGIPTNVPLTIPTQPIPDVKAAGEKIGQSLLEGFSGWMQANGPHLLATAIGAAVGGIAFGPIGFLAGATFGGSFIDSLQKQVPDLQKKVGAVFSAVAAGLTLGGSDAQANLQKESGPPGIAGGGPQDSGARTGALKDIQTAFEGIRQAADAVGKAVKEELWPQLEKLGGEIGARIAALFANMKTGPEDAAGPVHGLALAMGELNDNLNTFISIVTGLGAGFATFKILSGTPALLGRVAAGLRLVLSPIGLISIAVGALVIAWETNWNNIQGKFKDSVDGLVYTWEHDLKPMFDNIGQALNDLETKWEAWEQTREQFWQSFWDRIGNILDGWQTRTKVAWDAFWAGMGLSWDDWQTKHAVSWQAFWAGIGQDYDDWSTKTKVAWDAFWLGLGNAWDDWQTKRAIAWQSFWAGVQKTVETIGANIKALFEPGGVFGQIMSSAGTIGHDIVTGLQDGISGALSGFEEWIKTNLAGALPQWVRDVLGIKSPSTVFAEIGHQLIAGLEQGMFDRIKSLDLQTLVGRLVGDFQDASGGSVTSWLSAALAITQTSFDWLPGLLKLVSIESSGNPHAVNPISVGGEHATGLLQTLPSTFNAYKLSGFDDIEDPIANAIAAIRYIKDQYGSVFNIPHTGDSDYQGYGEGGVVPGPRGRPVTATVHGGEGIFTPDQLKVLGGGGAGTTYELHFHDVDLTDRGAAAKFAERLRVEMAKHGRERSRNLR